VVLVYDLEFRVQITGYRAQEIGYEEKGIGIGYGV
jgi:hypothetical protein